MLDRNSNQETDERRGAERKSVSLPGTLIFDGGTEECTVFDISPRGANVTASNRVPIDRPIKLKLTRHGEFVGKVVWRRGERMGLKFLHLSDDPKLLLESGGNGIRLVS